MVRHRPTPALAARCDYTRLHVGTGTRWIENPCIRAVFSYFHPRNRILAAPVVKSFVGVTGVGALVSACLFAALACERPAGPIERPERVLLVTVDTLRADHVADAGRYPQPTMPFVDALLARGTRFTRAVTLCVVSKADSIGLVEESVLRNSSGTPKRITVSVSSIPSRRLAAVLGLIRSSQRAVVFSQPGIVIF